MAAAVSVLLVCGFCLLSGMGIASIRAFVMFGLKLLGEVLGRCYDYITAISLAGLLLVMGNPFIIYNSGFQMSFMSIIAVVIMWEKVKYILCINSSQINWISIIYFKKNKNDILKSEFKNIVSKTVEILMFSISVSIFISPIVAYYYFSLPTYAFVLNIVVIPLMSVVVVTGVCAMLLAFINPVIGSVVILPGCVVLGFYEKLCNCIKNFPKSNIIVGQPSVTIIAFYYIVIFVFIYVLYKIRTKENALEKQKNISHMGEKIESKRVVKKHKRRKNRKYVIAMIALMLKLNFMIYWFPMIYNIITYRDTIITTFMDVGQGDGIYMRTPNGTTITVDGGSTSIEKVGKYNIIPYIKSIGTDHIDYAFMTHADRDHISGLLELIEQSDDSGIKVYNLVLPDIALKDDNFKNIVNATERKNINLMYVSKGDVVQLGQVKIKCVHPDNAYISDNRNDYSTVLDIEYNRFSMLLTGDIPSEVEGEIYADIKNRYTVLKVAHHGSKNSSCENFLAKVNPRYSIISVGEHNLYGHPADETIQRLENQNTTIYRTDQVGAVEIKSDGEHIEISGWK